uniref:Cytoplasmic dynein 2 heavy chain 1 n=1 Tax=Angiostrongylus cantonensis TaxID=6313 RepID=A0A158PC70_ANGCA
MGVKLDELKTDTKPFILTAAAQSNKDTVLSWLSSTNRQPFLVVGPDGCGKEELLKHCFAEDNQSQLAIVHSSAQSRASAIMQCLLQHCVQTSSASGRVLRPKDKPWLILYLKNIDLPAPDKYGTNEMLTFLHQLLTYEGYYDEHLDWIGLENVQVNRKSILGTISSQFEKLLKNYRNTTGKTKKEVIFLDHIFVTNGTVVPSSHNAVGLPLIPHSRHDYQVRLRLSHPFIATNFLGGSVLLAGRSGLGRADAIRLIANMHEMTVFTPRITPNYGQKQFDMELKNAIQTALSNNEHVVFLLEDYKILRPQFLQAINVLVSSGDVPGLFSIQELDALSTALRDQMSQDGFQGDMQQYFAQRVRTLLHVGLVLDTDSTAFEARIAENPAIFKQSNVIWQDSWGRASVLQVCLNSERICSDVKYAKNVSIQHKIQSPYKFQRCIENYASIYEKKKSVIAGRLERLKAGVSKLTEAREQVALMQKTAATKSKLLAEKQADADEALKDISKSMTGAEDQKTSMQQLRAATEEENMKIAEKKKKIEEQLKDVEPLLEEARSAVGSIRPESLSEIRSLRAPPEAIRDILQAVLLFMGILDTSWEAMRRFLSKSSVKDEIINFDAHRITRDVHKKVSALVQGKQASFDPKNAKRASVAAAPLAAWVTANLQYSAILEKISPLEQEKNELISNLSKAEKQIQKLSKGLLTVDEKVAALKEKFEGLMKEATQIKIDLEKEQETIAAAGTLVDRLAGEFSRWQIQMESLTQEMDNVESCSIITAAFVTYLGGCSEKIRTEVLKTFQQNINLNNFSPVAFCAMETEQLNWRNHGLPADSLSIENTVIIFNGSPTPLIIDPTGRVASFLHSFIQKSEVLRAAQTDLFTQIEFGIRFGKTIIVDDVTEVDAALVPIFRRELSSQGPRQVITFADKQIDYHPDFKLFLCTKNQQIVIPSSIRNVLSEVNFTTTRSGLASQLLGLAIQIERPELEEKSSSLARDTETKKVELENLEQLLLQQLASSEENLLGNAVLLNSLNKSKENAETISRSIMESEKLHKELTDVLILNLFPFLTWNTGAVLCGAICL